MSTRLPAAVQDLVSRTLWATFRVTPRPRSLADSMQLYTEIQHAVAPHGAIVHYKQAVCPVTKERLDKLQVLVEDRQAAADRVDVVRHGEQLVAALSPLETELATRFRDGRLQLRSLTRDYQRFKNSVHT